MDYTVKPSPSILELNFMTKMRHTRAQGMDKWLLDSLALPEPNPGSNRRFELEDLLAADKWATGKSRGNNPYIGRRFRLLCEKGLVPFRLVGTKSSNHNLYMYLYDEAEIR